MSLNTYEKRIVWRVNQQRGPNLERSACLDRYALQVARQLTWPLKHADLGAMMRDCGAYAAGECIALLGTKPWGTVQAWMHSPGHRAVLMRHRYHRIGVATIRWGPYWLTVLRVTDRSR
jgi:uncharacterized protein YkwD